jgi:hypothetical protein
MMAGVYSPFPAFAECSPREVLCAEEVVVDPTDARTFLESELGQSLPKDIVIVSFLEGGFQDLFIEVEFAGSPKAIGLLLQLLQVDPDLMMTDDSATYGLSSDPAWSLTADTPITTGEGILGSFVSARVAVPIEAGTDGLQRLFLVAFKM